MPARNVDRTIHRLARGAAALAVLLGTAGAAAGQTGADAASPAEPRLGLAVHAGFGSSHAPNLGGAALEALVSDHVGLYAAAGYPSVADIGIFYRAEPAGNGLVASAGIGRWISPHASLGWQLRLARSGYLTLGAGVYPAVFDDRPLPLPFLSYEHRFGLFGGE